MDYNFARADPTIRCDPRVIQNLLTLERSTMITSDYFVKQSEVEPYMRNIVTSWMLEVCDEQKCEDQVFPLAINYFDRFLSMRMIPRRFLQLLGSSCLIIASKIRQCHSFNNSILIAYNDNAITSEQLKGMEACILSTLSWNMNAVTAFDYIDHLLNRVASVSKNPKMLREHSCTLLNCCLVEVDFIQTPPSELACAVISSAIYGLNLPSAQYDLETLCRLTNVNPISVALKTRRIDDIIYKKTFNGQISIIISEQQQIQIQKQQYEHRQRQQYQQQEHILEDKLKSTSPLQDITPNNPVTPTDIQEVIIHDNHLIDICNNNQTILYNSQR